MSCCVAGLLVASAPCHIVPRDGPSHVCNMDTLRDVAVASKGKWTSKSKGNLVSKSLPFLTDMTSGFIVVCKTNLARFEMFALLAKRKVNLSYPSSSRVQGCFCLLGFVRWSIWFTCEVKSQRPACPLLNLVWSSKVVRCREVDMRF